MACPHPMVINGELVQAEGGKVSAVINPATGKEFDTVPDASNADANRAVAAAKDAFPKWRSTPFADRAKALVAFADELDARKAEFAEALTREQGKPIVNATWEVGAVANKARTMADPKNELTPEEYEKNVKGICMAHWEPRGVVVGIMPWNFPMLMAANKLFPALITGNTVVLKPSPFTPLSTVMLSEIAAKTLPPGVANIITGGGECGQTLVANPDVKMVEFTGSTATGKKIMATCAGELKKIRLELGGNDAAIILPGSDIQKFAPTIFDKAMYNTGQVCIALKRLYVHSSQYEEMVEALGKKAKTVTLGDGMEKATQYGPLNNKMQLEIVETLVNDAKSSGARIVAGGERVQPTGTPDAYFYAPTIIADVSDSARIVCEEQFGPALPVLKYDDVEDAVRRANDTNFGLGSSVWGPDVNAAAAVATQLQAGSIWLNTHVGGGIDVDAPFGGIKQSGIGTEAGGKMWLKSFCDEKYLHKPAAMKIELYASYKCPFARRALLAIEEKGLSYDFIPIPLSGELKKLDAGVTELDGWEGKSADELRKIKEDYKKDINASGEVPTLVVDGLIIKEADIIVEYLQDAFPKKGESLMPGDALQRSKIRHYMKILGGPGGVSGMYGLIMNQDPAKDEEIRKKVYAHWASFAEMAGDDGPFFTGKAISVADVMLMPMYDQFSYVWPHYRGAELIPSDAEAYPWVPRVQKWADAVKERISFKKCHDGLGKEMYIKAYGSYAGERGAAKFGA